MANTPITVARGDGIGPEIMTATLAILKEAGAWLRTIEDGAHTFDIFKAGVSREKLGTQEFAAAVIARLGQKPENLKAVEYRQDTGSLAGEGNRFIRRPFIRRPNARKKTSSASTSFGIGSTANSTAPRASSGELGEKVRGEGLKLRTIANRDVKVYPGGFPDTFTVDHWRCRFVSEAGEGNAISHKQINALLARFDEAGLDVIKTENLYHFDGAKGYSA